MSLNIIRNIRELSTQNSTKTLTINVAPNTTIGPFEIVKIIPAFSKNGKEDIAVAPISRQHLEQIFPFPFQIKDYLLDAEEGFIYFTGCASENFEFFQKKYRISQSPFTDVVVGKIGTRANQNGFFWLVPGIDYDAGLSITIDKKKNVYIGGYFTNSITFGTMYLRSRKEKTHERNLFLAKLDPFGKEWIWAINTLDGNAKCRYIQWKNGFIHLVGTFHDQLTFEVIPQKVIRSAGKNLLVARLRDKDGEWDYYSYQPWQEGKIYSLTVLNATTLQILWTTRSTLYLHQIKTTWQEIFAYPMPIETRIIAIDWKYAFLKSPEHLLFFKLETGGKYIFPEPEIVASFGIKTILTAKNRADGFLLWTTKTIYRYNDDAHQLWRIPLDSHLTYPLFFADEQQIYFLNQNILWRLWEDERRKPLLGIVKSVGGGISGEAVNVEFGGHLSHGYQNLLAGYAYYIQENATIDIIETEFFWGIAINETTMIIRN